MTAGAVGALALDGAIGGREARGASVAPLDPSLALSVFLKGPAVGPIALDLPDLRPKALVAAPPHAAPAAPKPAAGPEAPKRPMTAYHAFPKPERYDGRPVPPLAWPVAEKVTSPFGYRVLRGRFRHHAGVDIRAAYGTPIRAAAEGVVAYAGWRGGYGRLVVVDHGGGVRTWYAHNRSIQVAAGDRVERGQVLARAGDSGHAYGSHVHFEVRLGGVPVDPLRYLAPREVEVAESAADEAAGEPEGVGGGS